MAASNVAHFTAAAGGPESLAFWLRPAAEAIRMDPASHLDRLQDELPDSDRRIVADAGMRALLAAAHAEALRSSEHGWIDDALAFCVNWGFDLAQVTVPVLLWHGESDVLSPASHARWLAGKLPRATVVVQSDAAHFSALDVLPDVLRWVASEDR
jgi:pimeloyl-ACP methyl ester carboxylesterase